jgi:gas vesicle protein
VTVEDGYGEEGYTVRGQNRYTIDSWSRKYTGQMAFLLGLFVGAGATLLLTSMSGKETRGKIIETSKTLTDQAGNYFSTARDTATEVFERGRTWIKQIGPAFNAAIQSGTDAYTAEKTRIAEEIEGHNL